MGCLSPFFTSPSDVNIGFLHAPVCKAAKANKGLFIGYIKKKI